jgi:hypothetical protein
VRRRGEGRGERGEGRGERGEWRVESGEGGKGMERKKSGNSFFAGHQQNSLCIVSHGDTIGLLYDQVTNRLLLTKNDITIGMVLPSPSPLPSLASPLSLPSPLLLSLSLQVTKWPSKAGVPS